MFKTISIAILSALIINIVSFNVYNLYVEQEFKGQVVTTNYLNDKITKLKSNVLEIRADSIGSISRADLDDTKKFIEYEVSMNKKSIQDFIGSLNKDMERLNVISNLSQENDEYFQEKIEYLLQEIQSIQDQLAIPLELIDVPVVIPEEIKDVPAVVEQETITASIPVPEETNTAIEAYPTPKCSYTLNSGTQNSTKGIQRAVNKTRKKGDYNISVFFNINSEGQAEILNTVPTNPVRLVNATEDYITKLKFIKNNKQLNCEMSFKLNVT